MQLADLLRSRAFAIGVATVLALAVAGAVAWFLLAPATRSMAGGEALVGGPFRWVRNPGYVSVLALLLAQSLIFASPALLAYAAALALGFHLFVVFYEEPTLRRQFGAEYEAYCRAVPRWLPRRPPR